MQPARNSSLGPFTFAVGCACLLTLNEASTPGLSLSGALMLGVCYVLLAAWLIGVLIRALVKRTWTRFMLVPLALVLGTALLVKVEAPLHARFALSESSMEHHARSLRSEYGSPGQWGLFQAGYVEKIPGGARFLVTGLTVQGVSYGFAYSPNGAPDPDKWPSVGPYEHFKGSWYIWKEGI